MKIKHFIVILFSLPALMLTGQVSYDDVAVIINKNDNNSVSIGEYFAQQRNIAESNLVYIQCPSVELIDSAGFIDIRHQIEEKMESQGLVDKVNYLVTTKGIPFNVRKSESCEGLDGVKFCTSFDSEISLLFSEWNDEILKNGSVQNPYYEESGYFNRNKYGIYLVTRLDAYSLEDVKTLIDRSGPGIEVAKSSAQFIIDFSSITEPAEINLFTDFVQPAMNFLTYNDWHVIFNPSEEMVTGQSDVLGYYSINYQPIDKTLDFNWLKGSISEILLSTGNLTFYKEQNVFNELSVPDLLEEGVASSCTYANSMFFSQIIQLPILYERYLDEGQQPSFNLAESYFMAMPVLSTQYLVIGDPKTSLRIQQSNTNEYSKELNLMVFPNPSIDIINIAFMAADEGNYTMNVSDMMGRTVYIEELDCITGMNEKQLNISLLSDGMYFINLAGDGKRYRTLKFIKAGD
jgi:uncharacterized protein (TIGR03790 family)